MVRHEDVEHQNEVPLVPEDVKSNEVVIRTVGMTSAFEGEGFPPVFRAGTRMSKAEAKRAFEAADRTPDLEIEEVTKP